MAISVYDWGSVLEQLQTGNQELKPNFSKAMKIKSQITSQEMKRKTRWWYRLRRQSWRLCLLYACVCHQDLCGCECTCHWKGGALLLVFFSEVYCNIATIHTELPLLPLWVSLLLSYCLCPDLRIWVYLSLEKGESRPDSSILLLLSYPILFALSIVSIVCILLPLIWERPGLPQLQCGHFRKQKKENILPTPILAYNNMQE